MSVFYKTGRTYLERSVNNGRVSGAVRFRRAAEVETATTEHREGQKGDVCLKSKLESCLKVN